MKLTEICHNELLIGIQPPKKAMFFSKPAISTQQKNVSDATPLSSWPIYDLYLYSFNLAIRRKFYIKLICIPPAASVSYF